MIAPVPFRFFITLLSRLTLLSVTVGTLTRIVLMCNIDAPEGLGFGFGDFTECFLLGLINDTAVAVIAFVFMWLFMLTVTERKYKPAIAYPLLFAIAAAFCYLRFVPNSLEEFNRGLNDAICWILVYWAATFAMRLWWKKCRRVWTRVWFVIILTIYVVAIYFNAVSEYFFWAEFNVRYNFIAVDYLVYTNEVIGNIMESYSIVPLMTGVAAISAITLWFAFRKFCRSTDVLYEHPWKAAASVCYVIFALLSIGILKFNDRFQQTDNSYLNELQANGLYRFYQAFLKNELEFTRFYQSIPDYKAQSMVNELYHSTGENIRQITPDTTIIGGNPNIILITIESMSADFMERYGNTEHLTPNLDSIARHSLVFDRTFATGNRTVRGLEAVTLSLPPCPGQSIVKRPENKGRQSIGGILADNGYEPFYFYGGNSYFDNMGSFFSNNGYTVVDAADYTPSQITYRNIWGVCDEDSYNKVLSTLDSRFAADSTATPVFAHIMTISNHRPYTYPEGRIAISPESKTRQGGVMYTDYALGEFIRQAQTRPWGKEAVYVIVADHCASSAGKTELPLEKYHIPAMIYAPAHLEPQVIDKTISQIDIMPTLLGLLGISYESRLFGTDVLSPDYSPRAFIATYQDLGYFTDSILTVLSPMQRIRQFRLTPTEDNPFNTEPVTNIDSIQALHATALYQTSSAWNRTTNP
ncbi:MAG: sulfatase-like hydrolase/transferase [Paramuribaculum sp.]|nr:sulfatase-like hydrolase/transferase [Paramuribaculum sp.]